MICLHWIRSEKRQFTTFVANRIGKIVEQFDASQWRWIPTKDIVGDDQTRNSLPTDFSSTNGWINGPEFLYKNESQWSTEKEEKFKIKKSNSATRQLRKMLKRVGDRLRRTKRN